MAQFVVAEGNVDGEMVDVDCPVGGFGNGEPLDLSFGDRSGDLRRDSRGQQGNAEDDKDGSPDVIRRAVLIGEGWTGQPSGWVCGRPLTFDNVPSDICIGSEFYWLMTIGSF